MRKSKPELLQEFIKILFEQDPMGLNDDSNPDKETEYDGEALSILSRFTEGHLAAMPWDDALHVANAVVQSAFTFWFTGTLPEDKALKLAEALLTAFIAAYPEQKDEPEVVSEP
jgi:hypothetical protein